jgi:E1A/CREB-binding protein
MTSDIDPTITNVPNSINNTSVQQTDQRRQIIHHLALLLHAHKCLQRERQTATTTACNGDNHGIISQNSCTLPHCSTMRSVLQHMTKCADFKNCSCKFNN